MFPIDDIITSHLLIRLTITYELNHTKIESVSNTCATVKVIKPRTIMMWGFRFNYVSLRYSLI